MNATRKVRGAAASGGRAPPRRSPAGAKAEQRVRDIVRVGREVFSERGYERATITEIAQRLAISEATVFTYFHGKRELCVRVISDWYDEITAEIAEGVPRRKPVRAQLEFFVHAHLRLFLGRGTGMCALVLSEGRDKGAADLGAAVLPLHRRYTTPLMDLLSRGQADGSVRADVPLRLLRSLVLGADGADAVGGGVEQEADRHRRRRGRAQHAAVGRDGHAGHRTGGAARAARARGAGARPRDPRLNPRS
jgi:AcrR family transcriptional regulator